MAIDITTTKIVGLILVILGFQMAGCNTIGTNNGDVAIHNEDNRTHDITITFDRGNGYPTQNESISVEPGTQRKISGFLPASDWPYPFYLHIEMDGKYATRTGHRWEQTVDLVIRNNETVSSPENTTIVGLTPAKTTDVYPSSAPGLTEFYVTSDSHFSQPQWAEGRS